MKQLATQTLILLVAMTIVASTFAQSPSTTTRQRRSGTDGAQPGSDSAKPAADDKSQALKPSDAKASDVAKSDNKDKTKSMPAVTDDGKTNRADQSAEEEAIVPYYNNFFQNYRLGPEDVISVV